MNKLVIGLLAATIATGGSVLNNPERKYDGGDWYGHTLSDQYIKFTAPYLVGLCLPLSIYRCAYYETVEGTGIVTSQFSRVQAEEWEDDGYLIPIGNQGFYLGL